jgi:hypothetical protein
MLPGNSSLPRAAETFFDGAGVAMGGDRFLRSLWRFASLLLMESNP